MIRFSLVIENQKNEYLICECPLSDTEIGKYEFLGGEIITDTLPSLELLKQQIADIVREKIGLEIDGVHEYERYWRDELPLWIHVIFRATIKAGNPQKRFYKKIVWQPIDKIDVQTLNMYGLQVHRKISECSYCQSINSKKFKLDEFFTNFFDKEEENLAILETLKKAKRDSPIYMLAFKQELIHLRASLIENTKCTKNITVQNYFRLYSRDDLADKVDALLEIEVEENLSLKIMIRESVDKYIAHYDKPSSESNEIYKSCVSVFSANGRLPLKKFIQLLNGFIMALIIEMWYDAGQLGVTMSDRCPEHRNAIINHGNIFASELTQALKAKITSVK